MCGYLNECAYASIPAQKMCVCVCEREKEREREREREIWMCVCLNTCIGNPNTSSVA